MSLTKEKYIYLCGPTVYNKVHIGNMRPIVTFDIILRAIKNLDKAVKFIHNITDIDDKIIEKSKNENISEDEIAKKYTDFYIQMLEEYNVVTIDYMPNVSSKMEQIEDFIKKLIDKDVVYKSNESFYFKTSLLDSYGMVSNNSIDNLKSTKSNQDKENELDFVLWKNKTEGKTWTTSLGKGRPGWHTECAAFIYEKTNGEPLLIHGGGIDLKFPHHENENAQMIALTNNPICHEWFHIGILNLKNQKMSKSLGNIIFADEFLNKYKDTTISSDLFRLIILSTSIKSTIELSDEIIDSLVKKNNQLEKIINFVLLNNLDVEKDLISKDIILDLSKGKFSNVYKEINLLIKKFNLSKDIQSALKIFSILSFVGFKMTKKNIDENLKKIYHQWNKEVQDKNYEKADELRKILLKNKLI